MSGRAFDYQTVTDKGERAWLREQVRGIAVAMGRMIDGILEAGERLSAVQRRLGQDRFHEWIELEFPGSYVTAWRRMAAWKQSRQISHGEIVPPEILLYLVSPTIPAKARRVIVERLRAGESLELPQVRQIVAAFRPPKKARVEALAAELADVADDGIVPDPLAALGAMLQESRTVRIELRTDDHGRQFYRLYAGKDAVAEGLTLEEAVEGVTPASTVLRRCARCEPGTPPKPLREFSRKKDGPGGRNWTCRACESKRAGEAKRAKRARVSPCS